jgi:hypothetical protein
MRSLAVRDGGFGQVIKQEVEKHQIEYKTHHSHGETLRNTKVCRLFSVLLSFQLPDISCSGR